MTSRVSHSRRPDFLTEFWFITSAVALLGPALAAATLVVDRVSGNAGALPFLVISPDSARTILGSIAGSLITIASLTSSLTIVTLQLLSNQYTPRTVRGFLASRRSQVVLGTFIGIFLYCLVTLVSVREPGDDNEPFVPSLSVIVSVVLAVVGLLVLVLFIHAMSQTIQVSTTAARIAASTRAAIDRVHGSGCEPGRLLTEGRAIHASRAGYVRGVDERALASASGGSAVSVIVRPGDFVTPATVIARVAGQPASPDEDAVVRRAVRIEDERDTLDDPAFGLRQLADIALRALSPGINDPSSAVTCLGYLRATMEHLAALDLPDAVRGRGSTVLASTPFVEYLGPLIETSAYAGADSRVVGTLLDGLASIAQQCSDPVRRAEVEAVRDEIRAAATDEAHLRSDRQRLLDAPAGGDPSGGPDV